MDRDMAQPGSVAAGADRDTAQPGSPKPAPAGQPGTEPPEHRGRGLLIFTGFVVSLTVGVILGQTVAYEDSSVYAAPRTEPVAAGYRTPPEGSGPAPGTLAPARGTRATLALGGAHDRVFEVAGDAALLVVRGVDLGDRLVDVTTLDGSAVPKLANRDSGPRLELVQTGAPGRVGADIQLNSRVRWTLRLTGRTAEQDVDMSGGRLSGIALTGGAARVVLRLPTPRGTTPVTLTGGGGEVDVQAGVPVRVRLGRGADGAVIDGKTRRAVRAGTTVTSAGWTDTANRYLITTGAPVGLLRVSAAPHARLPGPPPSAP
jgi:hypothetical protein